MKSTFLRHLLLAAWLSFGAIARSVVAAGTEVLFVATPLTEDGAFTEGIEGPACDAQGNIYAVNFARQQTIGKVTPAGRATVFVELPGKSVGNGIRFTPQGILFVADFRAISALAVPTVARPT